MGSAGLYLYGLIRATGSRDFGCIGLVHDGKPGRVYTISVAPIAAVVSEYAANGKVLPLRKNLEPHNSVIREVMKTMTIIPMTFGHVAKSEKEIARTLRRNRDSVLSEFERLDDKVEMGLRLIWDVDNIFEYLVREDPELAAYRDRLFGRSSGPSQGEKIELGRMFEECLGRERDEHTERIVEMFSSCAAEVKVNPPKGEKVVMDLAFLVDRGGVKIFEERICQAAAAFPAEYTFDYSGPWAPFNFVELDLEGNDA